MAGKSTVLSSVSIADMIQDFSVFDVMERWPESPQVFLKHGMLCVGCAIARFHTLGEACDYQEVSITEFCGNLLEALGPQAFADL